MKPLVGPLACLTLATLLATTTSAPLSAAEPAPANRPPLRVGVAPELPPMVFKQGKNLVGVEADLAQALGRELGRSIQFIELPWAELIDSLEANKIDIIMSSMSITRARLTRVAFSDPYLRVGQMALVRGEGKQTLVGTGLADKTVGVKKGTTSDLLVQQEFPRAKRKYFESGDEAAKALGKKKIDVYFSDSTLIWYLAGKYEGLGLVVAPVVFTEENLAWAMRRSDADLLDSVNKALKRLSASGELKRVLKRWMPRFE